MDDDSGRKTPADGREDAHPSDASPVRMPSARITTIVGGRPAGGPAVPAGAFPAGIEQVLTLAALDDGFRATLRADREAAVRARGIELTPAEVQLLKAMPAVVLEHAIDQVLVPSTSRRGFIKVASSVVLAMLAGIVPLTIAGCWQRSTKGIRPDLPPPPRTPEPEAEPRTLGIRPDSPPPHPTPERSGQVQSAGIRPDERFRATDPEDRQTRGIRPDLPQQGRASGDYWIRLAGYTALMQVPPLAGEGDVPVILVFHDAGKTVLDAVRAWRHHALAKRPIVVGVKWSGQPADVEKTAAATGRMLDELTSEYQVTLGAPIVAAGVGAGATVALEAALFVEKRFTAAVAVDGALPEGWAKRKPVDPKGTAVWAVVGPENPAAKLMDAQIPALEKRGIRTRLVKTLGATASDVGAAGPAWEWVSTLPK